MRTSQLHRLKKAKAALRKVALAYPEAAEDFPWGHAVAKVKGKIFVSTYLDEKVGYLSVGMKLPISNAIALTLPFAEPTRYGLGKSGWVTSTFKVGDDVPVEMLSEWIDESYRAIAPKRLVAQLEEDSIKPPSRKRGKPAKRRATARRR